MITIDIVSLCSIAACILSLIALGAVVVLYRSMEHWRARCLSIEAGMPALRREVELVASISARTGRQVKRIEHDYSDVADRVDVVELRGPVKSVGEAIDSARRGADTGRLAQQFGLSRGEAELVARLHGAKKSA